MCSFFSPRMKRTFHAAHLLYAGHTHNHMPGWEDPELKRTQTRQILKYLHQKSRHLNTHTAGQAQHTHTQTREPAHVRSEARRRGPGDFQPDALQLRDGNQRAANLTQGRDLTKRRRIWKTNCTPSGAEDWWRWCGGGGCQRVLDTDPRPPLLLFLPHSSRPEHLALTAVGNLRPSVHLSPWPWQTSQHLPCKRSQVNTKKRLTAAKQSELLVEREYGKKTHLLQPTSDLLFWLRSFWAFPAAHMKNARNKLVEFSDLMFFPFSKLHVCGNIKKVGERASRWDKNWL